MAETTLHQTDVRSSAAIVARYDAAERTYLEALASFDGARQPVFANAYRTLHQLLSELRPIDAAAAARLSLRTASKVRGAEGGR